MNARLLRLGLAVALVLLGSIGSAAQEVEPPVTTPEADAAADPASTPEAEMPPAPVATPEAEALDRIPPEVARHQDEWPLAHHDYANTRATFDAAINSSNVATLNVAWTMDIPAQSTYGGAASAPLIVNGVVYFQDLESNVYAIDLGSGHVFWKTEYGDGVLGPNGPAVGYGRVFVVSDTTEIAALDMATGEELWAQSTEGRPTGSIQPIVYAGHVYYGTQTGGYTGGRSGFVSAHNPNTGEMIWEFQTIQEGFWGNEALHSGGGIWYSPAIDTEAGVTFWGTGNPGPFPGTVEFPNGSSRSGDPLYTNSLLALAHDDGTLVWYNQVKPDDIFDHDFQNSPILASVPIDGSERDIVIGSGKLGEVVAFDRGTGDILWRTAVGTHQNDQLTEIPPGTTVVVYPGILGGVETPMAYADGMVYAAVLNLPTEHSPDGYGARTGNQALRAADEHTSPGTGTSELVAIDASTGEIRWTREFPTDNYGGATVVNDLVFTATFDGMIYALNRETGDVAWSFQAPGQINAWPAVAGDTIVWAAGIGEPPVLFALRLSADGQ